MSRCNGLFGVHRFQARYDLSAAAVYPKEVSTIVGVDPSVIAICEQSRQRTYVHDICVKCGEIVKREKGPSA